MFKSDQPFAILLSMGYTEAYIERAMNIHKKTRHGTNWNLSILVDIIDRIKTKENTFNKTKHKHSSSFQLQHFANSKSLKNKSKHSRSASNMNVIAHHKPIQKKMAKSKSADSKTDQHARASQLYMKAVSLYQNKHYEECERITKDVLRANPNHPQALQLYKNLVQQRLFRYNNNNNNNKPMKRVKKKRAHSMLFGWSNSEKTNNKKSLKKSKKKWKKAPHDHPCQIEFKRFIRENIQLNEYYADLEDRFVSARFDDIRLLKDFDAKMLESEIGLNALHCSLFMRKVQIFIDQITIFQKWLTDIALKENRKDITMNMSVLSDLFENNGITTFEALYRRIQCKSDMDVMMKSINNYNINDVIWNEIQLNKMRPVSSSVIFEEEEKYQELTELPEIPKDDKNRNKGNKRNKRNKGNKRRKHRSQTLENVHVKIDGDKNKKHQHHRSIHWGFTDYGSKLGENDDTNDITSPFSVLSLDNISQLNEEKVNDEEFFAKLSPSVKSIEDMYSPSDEIQKWTLQQSSNIYSINTDIEKIDEYDNL